MQVTITDSRMLTIVLCSYKETEIRRRQQHCSWEKYDDQVQKEEMLSLADLAPNEDQARFKEQLLY